MIMPAILDAGTVLMPNGTYTTSQSFPPLLLYPRQLATTMVAIQLLTPPAAAATFTLEVASTQNGVYSVINTYAWPAVSGCVKMFEHRSGENAGYALGGRRHANAGLRRAEELAGVPRLVTGES
jgi:hypothetical protein